MAATAPEIAALPSRRAPLAGPSAPASRPSQRPLSPPPLVTPSGVQDSASPAGEVGVAVALRDGANLDRKGRAEIGRARPIGDVTAEWQRYATPGLWQRYEPSVWATLAQDRPRGAKALSRLVDLALQSPTFQMSSDDRRRRLADRISLNLAAVQRSLGAVDAGSSERSYAHALLDIAERSMPANPEVLFENQAYLHSAQAQGWRADRRYDLDLPPGHRGVCFRAAVKWLATQLVEAPFEYERPNVGKILGKFEAFQREQMDTDRRHLDAWPQSLAAHPGQPQLAASHWQRAREQAFRAVIEKHATRWTSKFTAPRQTPPHIDRVRTSRVEEISPADLPTRDLFGKGTGIVLVLDAMTTEGRPVFSHALALAGGPEPVLFDPDPAWTFKLEGDDLPRAIERTLDAAYRRPGIDHLKYRVLRMDRNPALDRS